MWDKVNPDFIYPAFIEDGRYFVKCTLSEVSMNSEILIFAVITDEYAVNRIKRYFIICRCCL